ncbi:ATP-binding protein [Streptomyces sp. NPDC055210]
MPTRRARSDRRAAGSGACIWPPSRVGQGSELPPGPSGWRTSTLLDRWFRHRHAEAGLKVRYTTTVDLVNELAEAADEKKLSRTIARYRPVDMLCLDEFGYLDLDRAGAKLLLRTFTEREERRAIAIVNAHIVETGTESHRFTLTQTQRRRRRTCPPVFILGKDVAGVPA